MDVGIRARWESVDRHRVIGVLTVTGLVAGAAIAVFGLPPLDVHSPLRLFGMVCPFCGATRAVQALLRGDAATAWHYNPLAFLVIAGGAVVVLRGAIGLIGGRWLNVTITRRVPLSILGGVLFVALWVNQARHTAMLTAGDGGFVSEMFGMSTMVVLGSAATLLYLSIATRRLRTAIARQNAAAAPPAPSGPPAAGQETLGNE